MREVALYGGADPSSVSEGGRYHARSGVGPSGHALFVRDWRRVFLPLDGGAELDAGAFADRYVGAGFSWVALYLEHGADANASEELARELARARVETWAAWGLPDPATWRARLPRFLERARAAGARGLLVNPERKWIGSDDAPAFLDALELAGLPIIVASYGTPQGFPRFPWAAFAERATVGMPLLFDRDLSADPAAYFARGLAGWRAHGFEALDVAGSTWAHRGDRRKTLAELARHLGELPRTPAAAIWSPVPLDAQRAEILEAWNAGDLERLAELGRAVELPRRGVARARARGGAGVIVGALALLGLAGAALRR